jgi:hypothetical protein
VVMATADREAQRTDLQFGPQVSWSESVVSVWVLPTSDAEPSDQSGGVRAMYARLARAYDAEPTVPDHRGGVPGDRFPL